MASCVVVTGASGHVGCCLVKTLTERGYRVKAQYHNHLPNFEHPNLEWVKADILDRSAMLNLVDGSEYVVHAAGKISVNDRFEQDVHDSNVVGTENVVQACIKYKVKRLIHLSSSHVVKDPQKDEVSDENRPYKTKAEFTYPYSKALAEQVVLKAVNESGLNAVVLRPTSIVGPPDHRPSLMGKAIFDIANGKVPILTTGGYDIVDVRDLCETIINSFKKGRSGEVYLTGGRYVSISELAKRVNPNKRIPLLPINLVLALLPFIKLYSAIFSLPWPISRQSLLTLKYAPKLVDSSKAQKELEHYCRPIEETIQDLLNWKANG